MNRISKKVFEQFNIDPHEPRANSELLWSLVEECGVSVEKLLTDCVVYMSDDEVGDMLQYNGYIDDLEILKETTEGE